MRCRDARNALHRAADGLISIEERLELDAHVADCERCAPLARRLEELEFALARLPEPPIESLDLEAEVRAVRARLDAAPGRRAPIARRTWWFAAAAALALAAAGTAFFLRRPSTDGPPVVEQGDPRSPAQPEGRGVERHEPLANGPRSRAPEPASAASERVDADLAQTATNDTGAVLPTGSAPIDASAPDRSNVPARVDERSAPTAEELARAEAARAELAKALASVLGATTDERAPLRAAFERAVAPLERAQWPVVRLAEGLAAAPDASLARPALRYLGLFGDRSSVAVLRRALEKDELAPDAVLALADLGEPALDVLGELVVDPRREPSVLGRLAARGDDAGPRCLEALVRRSVRGESALPSVHDEDARRLRSRALLALARSGPGALAALLRLATEAVIPHSDALALARTMPGAADTLAGLVRSGLRGVDPELALAAVRQLHPPGGIAWLDERARSSRELRDDALDALATWDDPDAALALLRWHASGRTSAERTRGLFTGLCTRHPAVVASLASTLAARRERTLVHDLFELLTERPAPASVPALVELAATELLVRGDRRTALQLAAELGTRDDARWLEALWPRLDANERELRAACVLALHRLGGRDALAALFARAPQRALDRLLSVCDDADASARPTTTLFRVLQELDSLGSRTTP